MVDPDRRRRSRSGRLRDAVVWGTALGAAGGAVLGAAIDGVGAGVGAVVGAAVYAPAEVLTTMNRSAGEIKPLWQRIFSSALLMALFGWLLGLIYGPDELLLTAIISGALLGLLGLRPGKVALGLLVGAGLEFVQARHRSRIALVAAAVAIVSAWPPIATVIGPGPRAAEEVPAAELRYVVPFEARSGTSAPITSSSSRRSGRHLPPQSARRRSRLARRRTGRPSTRAGTR
jgi:hypothetical protein